MFGTVADGGYGETEPGMRRLRRPVPDIRHHPYLCGMRTRRWREGKHDIG